MNSYNIRNAFELPEPYSILNVLKNTPNYVLDFHEHDFFHVNIITKGSMEVITHTNTLTVPAGYVYIVPPHTSHKLASENGYEQIGADVKIHNTKYDLSDILYRISNEKCTKLPLSDMSIINLISQKTLLDPSPFMGLKCTNIFSSVILQLAENAFSSRFHDEFIKAVTEISNDYSLEKLCKKLSYSKSHLERLVKKEFECSAIEFIERIRFTNICNTLSSTNMPLYEIAEKYGFYDSSHLSVFFKKRSGISPIKYRNEFR